MTKSNLNLHDYESESKRYDCTHLPELEIFGKNGALIADELLQGSSPVVTSDNFKNGRIAFHNLKTKEFTIAHDEAGNGF